jgi:hypothetical protein
MVDASWQRLKNARMQNIPCVYAQVLSERAEERMDLTEVDYILAASHNDAFNLLACSHFTNRLDRNHIFHLPILENNKNNQDEDIRGGLVPELSGLSLHLNHYTAEDLIKLHHQGYRFRCTLLTAQFTPEKYEHIFGAQEIPVVVLHANGSLSFFNEASAPNPAVGDRLIAYSLI